MKRRVLIVIGLFFTLGFLSIQEIEEKRDNSLIYWDEGQLTWKDFKGKEDSAYLVEIADIFNTIIYHVSTNDTLTVVDLNRSEFISQEFLVIKVSLEKTPNVKSDEYTLSTISEERKVNLGNISLTSDGTRHY